MRKQRGNAVRPILSSEYIFTAKNICHCKCITSERCSNAEQKMANDCAHECRSAALVSPCILSPGLQAERKSGKHWGYPFIEMLMKYNVDLALLPCPESSFGGYRSGLRRGKHGIDFYLNLDGYREHCACLAEETVRMVMDMQAGGCCFICMLGVEHSPTCAVNYMYSHQGMLKRAGMFYEALERGLKQKGLVVRQIGINRTHPQKALNLLEQTLRKQDETVSGS